MVTFTFRSYCIVSVMLLAACQGKQTEQANNVLIDTVLASEKTDNLNINKPVTNNADTTTPLPIKKVDTIINSEKIDSIKTDTLVKRTDTLPVRIFGRLIMNEKVIASDAPITFQIMDSLVATKVKDRQFYFKVFNKIMGRADGALSEAIGVYSRRFVEKHTKQFFAFSAKFTTIEMETWASQLGIELFLAEEHPKDAYNKTARLLKDNCASCDAATLKRIDEFNAMVLLTIKENEVKK